MTTVFEHLKSQRTDRKALEHALCEAGAEFKGSAIRCPFHKDARPSAGVYQGNDGVWRFKCHSCGFNGDVIDVQVKGNGKVLERSKSQASGREQEASRHAIGSSSMTLDQIRDKMPGQVTHEHVYHNAQGQAVMRVYRCEAPEGKTYRPVKREEAGWSFGQLAKPWPLYQLPEVLKAKVVVVVEGEKAADALNTLGITATTGPHGAGKAAHCDWTPLAGKKVILWPDCDEPGRKHMDQVREKLKTLVPVPEIKALDPAILDLQSKEDAFDFIEQVKVLGRDVRAEVLRALGEAKKQSPAQGLRELIEDTASGKREAVGWPFPQLSRLSRALLPGTVTLICGDPGATKSFFLLQCLAHWIERGIPCCVFELEDDRAYHLNRVLAQRAACADLFDPEWVKANHGQTKAFFDEHEMFLDEVGSAIFEAPDNQITLRELAQWVQGQCRAGNRIIAVDPVTAAEQTDNPWKADATFLDACKKAIRESGSSLILVTHPKKGNKGSVPGLDDLAGGAAYQRFAHCILWIERHKELKSHTVKTAVGRMKMEINRTVHICKSRNGPGAGLQLACQFDGSSLLFAEQGIVLKD
ncbi:MAG: AAA family ATPase [Phycisphaeraceae bacterium]|nr:AAA family ATPase [Phycisphaeraceae bacterium]